MNDDKQMTTEEVRQLLEEAFPGKASVAFVRPTGPNEPTEIALGFGGGLGSFFDPVPALVGEDFTDWLRVENLPTEKSQ